MRIAITDNFKPNFELYLQWLQRGNENVDVVKISYRLDNLRELDRADGLVLTGGGDVDPALYHRVGVDNLVRGVDSKRDEFELRAIKRALHLKLPMLGICRGLQVVNVALGGTLFADLVSSGYQNHRQEGSVELLHSIAIEPDTVLWHIVGATKGDVNSAHHQAADVIGQGLRICARSSDGVVEALEWSDPSFKPFLLLVQWHPERMNNVDNPTSRNILQAFLHGVQTTKRTLEVKLS